MHFFFNASPYVPIFSITFPNKNDVLEVLNVHVNEN